MVNMILLRYLTKWLYGLQVITLGANNRALFQKKNSLVFM
jgi:hypothetical protein